LPSDREQIGFVAQEVREVIPEAVVTRADGYLELNVDPIHWAVVNAIKELAEENELLKKQNTQFEAKSQAIEAKSQAIEAENKEIKAKAQETEQRINLLLKVLCKKDQSAEFCK